MRSLWLVLVPLSLLGCDDEKPKSGGTTGGAVATTTASATTTATASAAPSVSAPKIEMPPRPFPVGSSGPVQPSAPPEDQMMAINYTLAMVAPRPSDPGVDKAYAEAIVPKLEVAARTADKGKTPDHPVSFDKGGRKIKVDIGKGCNDKLPSNLIQQRAGSSLKDAFEAGVLVISCHDDKWECHQSTRDPNDVLCHAAPRHGK